MMTCRPHNNINRLVADAGTVHITPFIETTAEIFGFHSNILFKGTFLTPAFDRAGLPPEMVEPAKASFAELIPMARTGDIDELAGVAAMLVSKLRSLLSSVKRGLRWSTQRAVCKGVGVPR